jgi:hypothetical protein
LESNDARYVCVGPIGKPSREASPSKSLLHTYLDIRSLRCSKPKAQGACATHATERFTATNNPDDSGPLGWCYPRLPAPPNTPGSCPPRVFPALLRILLLNLIFQNGLLFTFPESVFHGLLPGTICFFLARCGREIGSVKNGVKREGARTFALGTLCSIKKPGGAWRKTRRRMASSWRHQKTWRRMAENPAAHGEFVAPSKNLAACARLRKLRVKRLWRGGIVSAARARRLARNSNLCSIDLERGACFRGRIGCLWGFETWLSPSKLSIS